MDIDPLCETIGKVLDSRINFITANMYTHTVPHASLVLNTSTEHITQETFDGWLQNMPNDTLIGLQGNNYFSCDEHIRCAHTLEEFGKINKLGKEIFSGQLDCVQFTRFMIIGYKNDID